METEIKEPVFYVPGSGSIIDTAILRDGVLRSSVYNQTLEEMRERYPHVQIGEWDTIYNAHQEALKTEPTEITPEKWEYALCVLPPVGWKSARGVESFKMSERLSGNITAIYARIGDRCFTYNDSIFTSAEVIAERVGESAAFKGVSNV